MTEYRYAIADSGNNVLPGTFAKDGLGAQYYRIEQTMGRIRVPIDRVSGGFQIRPPYWDPFAAAGERVVYCRVDDGVVTIEPSLP